MSWVALVLGLVALPPLDLGARSSTDANLASFDLQAGVFAEHHASHPLALAETPEIREAGEAGEALLAEDSEGESWDALDGVADDSSPVLRPDPAPLRTRRLAVPPFVPPEARASLPSGARAPPRC